MSKIAWNDINWTLVQKRISRQQRRVYKASKDGNKSIVHAIQKRIIDSLDAKLLAVRRITIENKRRKIVGVDSVKILAHDKKMKLAYRLKLDGKASPSRRTCIAKSVKSEFRTLGISILEDRSKQMLAKIALEPEWEAIFESNSYGFRPGRSCHDAISTLFFSLRGKSRYVLDADIHKCFETIDHNKLIDKLSTFDQMKNQINAWLKAKIMISDSNKPDAVLQIIDRIPQDRIISPLLVNIALHGLGDHIQEWYTNEGYPTTIRSSKVEKKDRKVAIGFIRYLDEFIITSPNQVDITQICHEIKIWLGKEIGLKLSKSKIRIINSIEGFEFLGFHIISIKNQNNEVYKVKIQPSKASKARIILRISKLIQEHKSASSYSLINLLSSRIIGWANYFKYSECTQAFSKIDYIIFNQIRAWVFRRKSKGLTSRTRLKLKYFPEGQTYHFRGKDYKNNWILTGKTLIKGKTKTNFLPKMTWIKSSTHVKIKDDASPYDGNHLYWAQRIEKYSGFNHRICKLIRIQNGYCKWCHERFTPMDCIEVNYITPRSKGGSDRYENLQVLHKHCHIQKSHLEKSMSQ